MSNTLARRRQLLAADADPLGVLEAFVAEHGSPSGADVDALAQRTGLPPAAVRAALSFYADLRHPAPELRVCRGTSCVLAGAPAADGPDARPVYCLGYCDRSPAVLRGGSEVLLGCEHPREVPRNPGASPPPLPPARCLAREPIVLRRILERGAPDLATARSKGAYAALARALREPPEAILREMERSGERGRGGAGYPTAAKWRACAEAPGERWVVANGDEGDPGSYVDRVLMEADPHGILEGLLLCARAVGARRGLVFVRSEYPWARRAMEHAVREARAAGIVGARVAGSDFACELHVVPGHGSYVCGEETALLSALEGQRGEVRLRPPYPATEGLHAQPTVVNNVETLLNVAAIVGGGGAAYARLGTPGSSGTKVLCLNHGFARPGLVEVEFGTTLREVVDEAGGGAGGRPLRGVLLGGPMGSVVSAAELDVAVDYDALAARGIQLGHGGLVALPADADLAALLVHWLGFMQDESCGKCTPCALGSRAAFDLARDAGGRPAGAAQARLARLLDVMEQASLCAFGRLVPAPVRTLLELLGSERHAGAGPGAEAAP